MSAQWILDEIRKWPDDSSSIQERFFRTGVYTHLKISTTSETNLVYWDFTFRDFGMDHSIRRCFSVDGDFIVDVETGKGVRVSNVNVLHNVVFGRFNKHLRELYNQLGCYDY